MVSSRNLVSIALAAAVIGSIGLTYAQASEPMSDGAKLPAPEAHHAGDMAGTISAKAAGAKPAAGQALRD